MVKRGNLYRHPRLLAADYRTPLVVEITAVRHGVAYYREAGTTGKGFAYQKLDVIEATWTPLQTT